MRGQLEWRDRNAKKEGLELGNVPSSTEKRKDRKKPTEEEGVRFGRAFLFLRFLPTWGGGGTMALSCQKHAFLLRIYRREDFLKAFPKWSLITKRKTGSVETLGFVLIMTDKFVFEFLFFMQQSSYLDVKKLFFFFNLRPIHDEMWMLGTWWIYGFIRKPWPFA